MGTPIKIAIAVPTIEVKITYKIPKLGEAAVGLQVDPNRISRIPTLNRDGVPLMSMYKLIEATARTAKKPQIVKIISAARSTPDLLPWPLNMEYVFGRIQEAPFKKWGRNVDHRLRPQ
jgi:hypothetical protein